jgi:hypothetical protein
LRYRKECGRSIKELKGATRRGESRKKLCEA